MLENPTLHLFSRQKYGTLPLSENLTRRQLYDGKVLVRMAYSPDDSANQHDILGSGQRIESRDDVLHFILESLGDLRVEPIDKLQQEIEKSGGDLEIESQEGVGIIGKLEGIVGRSLAGPEDLKRDQVTSLKNLTDLVYKSLHTPDKKPHNTRQRSQSTSLKLRAPRKKE